MAWWFSIVVYVTICSYRARLDNQIYLLGILMMIPLRFIITFVPNLPLLSSLMSHLIDIIIRGLNQLLMRITLLSHKISCHRLSSVMSSSRIYRKWMFNFIRDIAISWRRKVLCWFNLHIVHEGSIFLLYFMFINLFIIILSRTLRRCIISNFQLL